MKSGNHRIISKLEQSLTANLPKGMVSADLIWANYRLQHKAVVKIHRERNSSSGIFSHQVETK